MIRTLTIAFILCGTLPALAQTMQDNAGVGSASASFQRALDECTLVVEEHVRAAGGGQFEENVYKLIATCLNNQGFYTTLNYAEVAQ